MTALAIACKEGCIDIAFQLLAAGAYVNIQVTVVPACFILLLQQISFEYSMYQAGGLQRVVVYLC
jgi:hypothetical protein